MRDPGRSGAVAVRFQSAPGLEAGRCSALPSVLGTTNTFQSAPGLEAGRCLDRQDAARLVVSVSIRARP